MRGLNTIEHALFRDHNAEPPLFGIHSPGSHAPTGRIAHDDDCVNFLFDRTLASLRRANTA